MLVLWEIWKHRNVVVFDGVTPATHVVLQRVECEGRAWQAAGEFKGDMERFLGALHRWTRYQ